MTSTTAPPHIAGDSDKEESQEFPQGDRFILPLVSLSWRELIRFYRQKHRILGALGTPLVFWLLIGTGLGASFHPPDSVMSRGATAIEYLYPGTLVLILLFTSIFSTISVIEDRREGFLQSVLVAPASTAAIVLGKILGGTVVALLQGILFLSLAPWVGIKVTIISGLVLVALVFVISFGLTALGLTMAWRMQSTQGFHALMNLVLIPLWLLSGAFFPAAGAPRILKWTLRLNPISYAVSSLRRGLYWNTGTPLDEPSMALSVMVVSLFALVLFVAAIRIASAETVGDLK
ncbi:MAG: ABC transporter permease [Acidobacteriia bacterium]|nr:ABC transporter permease [Terriglobia bacterium]